MSTLQNNPWTKLPGETLDSKYEKCRNITEEIYKRINITFQIKKLETSAQSELSDHSDQIDSNELSNETDLFACDKSSISSSTELEALEQGSAACEKFINNNNNEESKLKKTNIVNKRPRKRFRKRVKKQPPAKRDSDGSSDEAPLSRVATADNKATKAHLHSLMGVPNVVITPIDFNKLNIPIRETKTSTKKCETKSNPKLEPQPPKDNINKNTDKTSETTRNIDKTESLFVKEKSPLEWNCTLCSLSFRGERGLRRHMTISHIITPDKAKKSNKSREEQI